MISHHLHSSWIIKTAVEVNKVSNVPMVVLRDDIKQAVKEKFPNLKSVHLAKRASFYGTNYMAGMILVVGSTGELPDFVEIVYLLIQQDKLSFIARKLSAWYMEHFRSFEVVSSENEVVVVDTDELTDYYPLASYLVGGKRMITLKRYVSTSIPHT